MVRRRLLPRRICVTAELFCAWPAIARAYQPTQSGCDEFFRLAESTPFNVATASVTTDQASYTPGSTITVTYAGMPGYADDWIALAPAGAPNKTYAAYVRTNGQATGTATFTAPAGGSYVVRAFLHNTFTLLGESSAFSMGTTTVSTDQASYAPGSTITVTYAGMPGYANDWIALASAGAANTSYVAYVATGGQSSGTATFTAPALGTYVARAFPQNTYARLAESATFSVAKPLTTTCPTVPALTEITGLIDPVRSSTKALDLGDTHVVVQEGSQNFFYEIATSTKTAIAPGIPLYLNGMGSSGSVAFGTPSTFANAVACQPIGGCVNIGTALTPNDSNGADVVGSMTVGSSLHAFKVSATGGTVFDLGTLGGDTSEATAINASGQIVGYSNLTPSGAYHAFMWDGTMHDLGTLGGSASSAAAINASGQVVGKSITAAGAYHAFMWDGTMHDLGALGGDYSEAIAINASGQVVGNSTTASGDQHAFFWSVGVMTDLGTLGGVGSSVGGRHSLNDAGQVVGASNAAAGTYHAFVWQMGVMRDLGTFGGSVSEAFGINAAGVVAGYAATLGGPNHAFIVIPGACTQQ
jgi:probable HAF family extracellular repeat protein